MYQFNENFNTKARFWFEKKLIKNKNWALLPKSSKAVFPVIARHVNAKGVAFPSERTIAILSGVSDKVVRHGIKGLDGFPGFKCHRYITSRGNWSKKFNLKLIDHCNGNAFPFFRIILEYGLWREMTPTARALYPVMRYFGYFDFELYEKLEENEIMEFRENYGQRRYEICEADNYILAEYAGIHRNSISGALNSLEHNRLIE